VVGDARPGVTLATNRATVGVETIEIRARTRAIREDTPMFDDAIAFSSFAVPDVEAARAFYGDTLGLDVRDSRERGLIELHLGGPAPVLVYPKPDHTPASFTVLNFQVPDIDAAVDALIGAGIRMERYPDFEQNDKGIARDPRGPAIAWFTDPAGNIVSVLEDKG
jgi:catechol 2,3-dioxygenase-like lactoylglutathione lyase family enzyme